MYFQTALSRLIINQSQYVGLNQLGLGFIQQMLIHQETPFFFHQLHMKVGMKG